MTLKGSSDGFLSEEEIDALLTAIAALIHQELAGLEITLFKLHLLNQSCCSSKMREKALPSKACCSFNRLLLLFSAK